MQPIIYLDVDGVLNILSRDGEDGERYWPDVLRHDVFSPFQGDNRQFRCWFSKAMGTELMELPAEIHWLTTWGYGANASISPLVGLPTNLPVTASIDDFEVTTRFSGLMLASSGNWKLEAILKDQMENPQPFIWVDDDAITAEAYQKLQELCHNKYLTVRPNYQEGGLTPDHLKAMREWLYALPQAGEEEAPVPT